MSHLASFVSFSRFMSHLSSFVSLFRSRIVCFVLEVHVSSLIVCFVVSFSRFRCSLFRSRGFVAASFVSLFRSRGFVARCSVLEVSLQQLYKQTYN